MKARTTPQPAAAAVPLVVLVPSAAELRRRLPRLVAGLVLCGLGIAAMVRARLGLGPWDVLHQGIARRVPLQIGTVGILVGAALLVLWIPLRQRPGLGTVLNTVLIGLVIDGALAVTADPTGLALRALLLVGGVVVFGIGVGMYIGAGLGAGPRDGIMNAIAARGPSIRVARTAVEVTALAAGWLLGGSVGVGTLLFALGIGPIVHVTLPFFTVGPPPPVDRLVPPVGE